MIQERLRHIDPSDSGQEPLFQRLRELLRCNVTRLVEDAQTVLYVRREVEREGQARASYDEYPTKVEIMVERQDLLLRTTELKFAFLDLLVPNTVLQFLVDAHEPSSKRKTRLPQTAE